MENQEKVAFVGAVIDSARRTKELGGKGKFGQIVEVAPSEEQLAELTALGCESTLQDDGTYKITCEW